MSVGREWNDRTRFRINRGDIAVCFTSPFKSTDCGPFNAELPVKGMARTVLDVKAGNEFDLIRFQRFPALWWPTTWFFAAGHVASIGIDETLAAAFFAQQANDEAALFDEFDRIHAEYVRICQLILRGSFVR